VKYLAIIYLLFVELTIHAQDAKPCPCNNELNNAFETKLNGEVYRRMPGLVGTEFFNLSYLNGDIYLENGEVSENQKIRYNGRIDGLLLLPPNSSKEILLDNYFIKGFSLKDFRGIPKIDFTKIRIANLLGPDSIQVFAQVLYRNKLSLYAYRRYVFEQEVIDNVGDKRVARQLYVPSFIYYFQLPDHKTIGFKSFKKRDLYKLFPGNKDLMRKLFREKHQRRFRNEDDLIRITEILNSLYN